ncbi:recombinase family protein [Ruminococcus albus]|uniref:Site-specific DNA recombinase n=1 Tax=Ruminococcus albus TaxID=1264 RepID=A0A1H7I8W2_RUMAL|nr:recombinase family protein [Ruminococcus albus]SEK57015.1 Site-specific DNA recombinase [Ruminococcus albus]
MDIYSAANKMKMERKTIFDLDIKVTFYARVSTTRDEQENSIENQINFFTDMIKNNPHWTYVEGYVDRVRGESAENRANFMRMIEDGKAGVFDLVLTKEVSRFARNTVDSLTYTRELLRAGVGVFFQNDNICTIDTDSELRLTIMSSIAADEVRKLSERVRWGHKRSIESGNVLGNNRIFGYDKDDCKLVINEKEAEMVRLIFELYSTGKYSSRKIQKLLYDKGYRGRNGTEIHHNTITGIISNPKYKGWYCGNKVKVTDYRTREQRFLPEDEWVMYKDETGEVVPAIVSEEIWEKCNVILRERSQAIKSRTRSFKDKSVFTGLIWCRAHNVPYWRTSYSNSVEKGEPVYQWICSEKKRSGAKSCSSFSIMEKDLYLMLSDHFKLVAEHIEEYVADFLKIYKETNAEKNTVKQINELKVQLEKEKAKREKLLDLYTEDAISRDEFKKRNDNANVLISQLEEDISELEKSAAEKVDYVSELKKIEEYFNTMYCPEGDMTKEQVDELARTIIDRIDVVPTNKNSMKLEIKLKTGLSEDITYVRTGERYARRSGPISKKMIDAYKTGSRN